MSKGERRETGGGGVRRAPLAFYAFPLLLLLVFAVALGVRLLMRQDTRLEVGRVQTAVTNNYRHMARLLSEGGVTGFFSRTSPAADPDTLGHPPGYPAFLALVGGGEVGPGSTAQLAQILADALSAVFVALVAAELLSRAAGVVAGLLVALAPQFAWNSVLLLPDTLAVLPILVAVYLVARALRGPRLAHFLAAGALVGLSCWLRANALLLAPFLAAAVLLLFDKKVRTRSALAVVAGALLAVAPLTLRNAYVFGAFVPVSLGAGQTMLEGIADFDPAGRFGIPATDLGIMRQEAAEFARPDYAESLFGPDAVLRERRRLARARRVILSNPVWFASVMARRAASMLRLERARTLSPRPQVTHDAEPPTGTRPEAAVALLEDGEARAARAHQSAETPDGLMLEIEGGPEKSGDQFASAPANVSENTDYLLRLPYRVARGRMRVAVAGGEGGEVLASVVVEPLEGVAAEAQPTRAAELTFVSGGESSVRLLFRNEGPGPLARFGAPELYALGPAAHVWTRYPRALLALVQKLFITAVMLPLSLAGLVLLAREKKWRALVLLLAVPVYYLCVQSALHTEYRYVLALHYFLFAAAAYALCRAAGKAAGFRFAG